MSGSSSIRITGIPILLVACLLLLGRASLAQLQKAGSSASPAAMQTPDQILTQAKTICEAAFADPTRNAPGQPGKDSVAVGSVLLLKKDLQSAEKNWYRSLWTLSYLDWQPENDVRSLLCVHQGEMAVGTYVAAPGASSTGTAYRADWEGRLVSWPDGRLLARRSFTGNPPPQMKFGQGDAYGGVSEAEVLEWLAGGLGVSPLLRHREGVWGVAIAPDGRKLAAAWGNGVTIWDLTSRKELQVLPHNGVRAAFSPDGKMLATSAPRDGIKVWDVATGEGTSRSADAQRSSLQQRMFLARRETRGGRGAERRVSLGPGDG